MTMLKSLLAVTIALMIPVAPTQAAAVKIGVIDMARIFNTHPDTRTAEAAIEQKVKEFEQERDTLLEKFQAEKDAYDSARKDAQNKAWSDAVRAEKETLANEKRDGLRDLERQMRETLEFRQKQVSDQRIRSRQRIVEKIKTVITEYAKEQGYTLILDYSETGAASLSPVLYHDGSNDITTAVLAVTRPDGEEAETNETP